MTQLKTRYRTFLLPLALMMIIFGLSSLPGGYDAHGLRSSIDLSPGLQNLLHIPMFGLLQYLWLRAFSRTGKSGGRIILICLGITLSYSLIDELHQYFVPGRYAALMDVFLNIVGVSIGTALFCMLNKVPQV